MPDTEISEDRWNQIFTLMAAVILVDVTPDPREIQAFISEADRLSTQFSPDAHITPEHIGNWLQHRSKQIRAVISGSNAQSEFINRVVALDSLPFRQDVLEAMKTISSANDDINDIEFDIINIAAAYWDLNPVRKT